VARWRATREQATDTSKSATSSPKAQPTPNVSRTPQNPTQPHAGEGVSVEAYMQQLLARSRRSANADAPWTAAPTRGTGVDPRADERDTASVNLEATNESARGESGTPVPVVPLPLPEPSHRQDKASARADLDSLRNVANTAARSAIAKYSTRATRERLLYRSLLTTLSILIAVALLTSGLWGDGDYVTYGWLAAAASAALGIDVLRASGKMRLGRSTSERHLEQFVAAEAAPDHHKADLHRAEHQQKIETTEAER
jgi:hypothetical protein